MSQKLSSKSAAAALAPQLVIFDCDGVLVDSEPVANRMLAQMLRELGLDLTQEQIFEQSSATRWLTSCA